MDVVQLNAPVYAQAIVVTEWDQLYSREAGVMNAGQAAVQFAVLGQSQLGSAAAAVKTGGNAGNGVLTPDAAAPVQANAQVGVYRVVFTGANAFNVFDPKGDELGQGAPGQAFNDQIKFAIAAGATPFVAGDEFDITVGAGAGGYSPITAGALDGTQNAAGVALYASDSDGNVTVIARGPIVLRRDMLAWPAGFTANQIAAAIAQLTALGIVSRVTG